MFFVFVFIFVKIYSIQTTIAADEDPSGKEIALSQETTSPSRKVRREITGKKVIDPEDSDNELVSRKTDRSLSPVRKGSISVRISAKENHQEKVIPANLPITILSPPRQKTGTLQQRKRLAPSSRTPTGEVTDDEDVSTDEDGSSDEETLAASSTDFLTSSAKDDTDSEDASFDKDDLTLEPTLPKDRKSPDSAGKLSPEVREALSRRFQLEAEKIDVVEALNCALRIARDMETVEEFLSAYPDPEDQAFIRRILNTYTSPVRKPNLAGVLLTPALRDFLTRVQIKQAKKEEVAESLPKDAFTLPRVEETEAERTERKRKQAELFAKIESERGKSLEDIADEIKAEAEIWGNHFRCILHRKKEAVIGTEEKITKNEIIDIFEEYVKSSYQMFKIEGYEVYVPLSLDLGRTDPDGLPNYEILKTLQQCPRGPDNEIMNYHHLTHHDAKTHEGRSIVVLITKTLHTKFSGALHFTKSTYKDRPSNLDRAAFTEARNSFGPKIIRTLDTLKAFQKIIKRRYSKG